MNYPRIAVAMSGGVDSSAAAALLREQGYDVVGFSMQLWKGRQEPSIDTSNGRHNTSGSCCSLDDLHDARRVAGQLGIPFYVLNFESDFLHTVIRPFVQSYLSGQTPSPCVLCNTHLKFDKLLSFSGKVHADFVATGHYAQVQYDEGSGRHLLLKGSDVQKDQSYFLFELKQDQLARTKFPLGNLSKPEVRRLASHCGLKVAHKPESQEICFVGQGRYAKFIDVHRSEILQRDASESVPKRGEIVDEAGHVLGTHQGIHHYTVGQRRGLGIAARKPLYVVQIDAEHNRIVVGHDEGLRRDHLIARNPNWIAIDALSKPIRAMVKIRSRAPETPAMLCPLSDGRIRVEFEHPLKAITPGQAVVFYQENTVLGGGWIDSSRS